MVMGLTPSQMSFQLSALMELSMTSLVSNHLTTLALLAQWMFSVAIIMPPSIPSSRLSLGISTFMLLALGLEGSSMAITLDWGAAL